MSRILCIVVLAMLAARASADDANPHEMIGADGKADAAKCNVCHNDDLTLTLPKLDTCTLCHSTTIHAGAQEHLRVEPARVALRIPAPKDGATVLPLTEEGGIYCGTCHIFHDPRVSEEKVLDQPWIPSGRLATAVREGLIRQIEQSPHTAKDAATALKFSDGTTRLRLPVVDGSLCRHCHQYSK